MKMPSITPFLWFDNNAQEAAAFYEAVFARSAKQDAQAKAQPTPTDAVVPKSMGVEFTLNGQRFYGLNGGPKYKFNEAVSFFISCETQEEIDYFWQALSEGGSEGRCGWLKDKFGLSWQVVPRELGSLLGRGKAIETMMTMSKLDITKLKRAAEETS